MTGDEIACTYPGGCRKRTAHVSGRCQAHRLAPPWLAAKIVPARFDSTWEVWLEAHDDRGVQRRRLLTSLRQDELAAVGRALDGYRERNGTR